MWTLGRGADTGLSIPWDSEVSALHAELQGLGGEWTIADDGLSRNGTFVNGERISGRCRLRDDDRIRVGRTIIVFKAAGPVLTPSTVSAEDEPAVRKLTDTQRRVLIALCRPFREGDSFASAASNQQIAAELFLSIDTVKMHLRTLFAQLFGLSELGGLIRSAQHDRFFVSRDRRMRWLREGVLAGRIGC